MSKAYPVVATQYGELTEAEVKALKHGTPAMLVRDPLNKFDPNAVAVYIDGKRVGYIPKKNNAVLAQFIDQQGEPYAVILAQDAAEPNAAPGAVPSSVCARHEQASIPAKFIRSPNSNFPMVEV